MSKHLKNFNVISPTAISHQASGITFRYIPAPRGYQYRLIEKNKHGGWEVGFVRALWMMEAPMTVGQVNALDGRGWLQDRKKETKTDTKTARTYFVQWKNEPTKQEAQLPETVVSYEEIKRWLISKLQDKVHAWLRLPTEFEWEWAALGGEDFQYAGCSNIDKVAWYEQNKPSETGLCDFEKGKAVPVKRLKPNGYGLYDMSGNVLELTSSFVWRKPEVVIRGGSWFLPADQARVACRNFHSESDMIHSGLGFRLCFFA